MPTRYSLRTTGTVGKTTVEGQMGECKHNKHGHYLLWFVLWFIALGEFNDCNNELVNMRHANVALQRRVATLEEAARNR